MEERIYFLAKEINESLSSNPLVKELNKLEKELNDSFEVYNLSNKKDEELEKYLSNKDRYGEEDIKTIESLKRLKEAKENLNNHPLVKSYLSVYSKVRDLYMEIDDIVLGDYK